MSQKIYPKPAKTNHNNPNLTNTTVISLHHSKPPTPKSAQNHPLLSNITLSPSDPSPPQKERHMKLSSGKSIYKAYELLFR